MTRALYDPESGYYMRPQSPFGAEGDFITAPTLSPLLAQVLAGAVKALLAQLPTPRIVEWGGGNGQLAADLIAALQAEGVEPDYHMVEISPHRREEQQQTLAARGYPHVTWHTPDAPPSGAALVLGNELFDAFPVEVLEWQNGGWIHMGVEPDSAGGWRWAALGAPPADWLAAIPDYPEHPRIEGDRVEICLGLAPWVTQLAQTLGGDGYLLAIDYGDDAQALYHPARRSGTLQAYHRHQAHNEVLTRPGDQDLTAFVDFSALARACAAHNLPPLAFTTQARFLVEGGILDRLLPLTANPNDPDAIHALSLAKRLMHHDGMGERFKVFLAGSPALELPPHFRGNRLHRLFLRGD